MVVTVASVGRAVVVTRTVVRGVVAIVVMMVEASVVVALVRRVVIGWIVSVRHLFLRNLINQIFQITPQSLI